MIEASKGQSVRIITIHSMQLKHLHTIYGYNSTTWILLTLYHMYDRKSLWFLDKNQRLYCIDARVTRISEF